MLLRNIYDDKLAQAAYLFGCQRTGEAIIIDPERDIDRYIKFASKNGLKIVACAETHIHADFLSGCREFAEKTGAKVYLSDEGDKDWKYGWLAKKVGGGSYTHELLHHGDIFHVGNIEFKVLHTPGHTPEHIAFVVTDKGGGANGPMGVATGDFIFVGDVGRPDLLETAAGHVGAKEPSARRLYDSIKKSLALEDHLQVWPAHGAGSACGKALGAVPQSTIGYEKRYSPAFLAATDEKEFVKFILAGQPEPPIYFARMKRQNRDGVPILGGLPQPPMLDGRALRELDTLKSALIDARPWKQFREGHIPGSLHIPFDSTFPTVAGSYIAEGEPIYLIAEEKDVEEITRNLVRVGLDSLKGCFPSGSVEDAAAHGANLAKLPEIDCRQAKERISKDFTFILDVRRGTEFSEGHIEGAKNINYTTLPLLMESLPKNSKMLVNCQGGARSARACAYLQRYGYDVTNLCGGFRAWCE